MTTNHEVEALKAVVHNRFAEMPQLLKLAELGAEKKAGVITAIAQDRVAAERKAQYEANGRKGAERSRKFIVWKLDLVPTADGPVVIPKFLGDRINITLHATTDARTEAREFHGGRGAARAAQLQGEGWLAVPSIEYDRSVLWSRVEPGPAEIPQDGIYDMGLERGLSL